MNTPAPLTRNRECQSVPKAIMAPHPLRYQHTIAQANQVHLGHPVVMHRAGQQADGVQELGQHLVVGNGRLLAQGEGSRWGGSA